MTALTTPEKNRPLPKIGFIGWGSESAAVYEALKSIHPEIERNALALATNSLSTNSLSTDPLAAPLPRFIPSLERLFGSAELIFAEGGHGALEPHLPMMRLAISDRHTVVLLGTGWSLGPLLEHLKERKLMRCMLQPSRPGQLGTLAYYATPYISPGELEAFRSLFGELELTTELKEESHFEVMRGLADFAPAAFYTILEAMADGVVMMGLSRAEALKFLTTLLLGSAQNIIGGTISPALLREQALEIEVAAAGLIEMESAGIRGTMMRAIQRAVQNSRRLENRKRKKEGDPE